MTQELVESNLDLKAGHLIMQNQIRTGVLPIDRKTLYFFRMSLSASLTKVFFLVPP